MRTELVNNRNRPNHKAKDSMTSTSFPEAFVKARSKGAIYLLVCQEINGISFCKIGMSRNPFRRLENISTDLPMEHLIMWTAIGARWDAEEVEKSAHEMEHESNTRREWFAYPKGEIPAMVERIEAICQKKTGVPVVWNYINGN